MEKQAMLFRPKMIIAGASAYPRECALLTLTLTLTLTLAANPNR